MVYVLLNIYIYICALYLVWRRLAARFIRLGGWKGLDRLALSP
jgi:hypothetical protein